MRFIDGNEMTTEASATQATHAIAPLGTIVKPWGKVAAIGLTGDERYYWFVDGNCVSMMPWFVVEAQMRESPITT